MRRGKDKFSTLASPRGATFLDKQFPVEQHFEGRCLSQRRKHRIVYLGLDHFFRSLVQDTYLPGEFWWMLSSYSCSKGYTRSQFITSNSRRIFQPKKSLLSSLADKETQIYILFNNLGKFDKLPLQTRILKIQKNLIESSELCWFRISKWVILSIVWTYFHLWGE